MFYADICIEVLMRTTLNLNDALIARAKALAIKERKTLTRLIEEGLALRIQSAMAEPEPRAPFRLRVFRGGTGMRPGIDPTSNASIYAASELDYDRRKAGLPPHDEADV